MKNKRKIDARFIALMGLLIALMVVMTRFIAFETQFLRISFTFIPASIMGMIFGPFWSGVGSALADIAGMALFPKAGYFVGFTINAFIEGAIYGFFFYKKPLTWKRVTMAAVAVTLLINFFLTPLWLAVMYNVPFFSWTLWSVRIIKNLIWLPVQIITTYYVGNRIPMQRLFTRIMPNLK